MNFTSKRGLRLRGVLASLLLLASGLFLRHLSAAQTPPDIQGYAVPVTLTHLSATVRTTHADQSLLKKITPDFGNAYRLKEATYTFDAPDKLEYKTRIGITNIVYTTTNTERTVNAGSFIHSKTDISKDLTKRNTIFVLGLLPKNYLETVRAQYVGHEAVQGIDCQVFFLRFLTDRVDDNRRTEVWIDPAKHYVVQKRVWNGGNEQHETIVYKNPVQVILGVWLPTRAEAYTPQMEYAGAVELSDVKGN